ncbi:MAG: nucleoside 2-deoxyribosyltransferase [Anaerolineaceae bacterium]
MNSLRLYISGPQKYYPNGLKELKMMKGYAEMHGFEVINDFSYLENGYKDFEHIDRNYLDNCDIVIADVNPFRGGEPESGTVFDMGVAFAKKKRLYSYVRDIRNVIHKYPIGHYDEEGRIIDEYGYSFGDGQTPGNLMYMIPSKMIEGSFIECIKILIADLHEEEKDRGQRVSPRVDHRPDPTWPVEEGEYRAYLAGYECFMLNNREVGDKMKAICEKYNFQGIFPPDDAPGLVKPSPEDFKNVYTRCAYFFDRDQLHIRNSNMVIANFNPYHGHEPDSGTVFEAAMSYGLGYRCYCFINDKRPLIERINCRKDENGIYRDIEGFMIENFGFPLSSRITSTMKVIVADYDEAYKKVAEDIGVYCE